MKNAKFWFDTREKSIVQNTHLGNKSCKQKICDLIVIKIFALDFFHFKKLFSHWIEMKIATGYSQ